MDDGGGRAHEGDEICVGVACCEAINVCEAVMEYPVARGHI